MAHQAHVIPWQTFISNLKFKHCNVRNRGITNLHLRNKNNNQEKELQYFVKGFSRALSNYSAIERMKYDVVQSSPELDERVISKDVVKKIATTVLRYKGRYDRVNSTNSSDDALSLYECTVECFVSATYPNEGDMSDHIRGACEQTKTMLMYGEMDPLFCLATHPSVYFNRLWDEAQYANAQGFGLSKLKDSALKAYVCLNVMFLRPELYNPSSRQTYLQIEAAAHRTTFPLDCYDYRLTAAYQHHYEAHTYPHRQFFGIPRGMFRFDDPYSGQKRSVPGTVPVSRLVETDFLNVRTPSKADIPVVIALLHAKGLPSELALRVLDMADYKAIGRLSIRDDPLHASNSEELRRYLSFCWIILVRIDMLIKASGQWLDWEAEVSDTMCDLFEMDGPNRRKTQEVVNDDTEFSRRIHRFVFSI